MKKSKNSNEKYWETEKGEVVKFGYNFLRCYDKAGKLQFGTHYTKKDGEEVYIIRFTLDRDELFDSDEGAPYLMQTLDDWKAIYDGDDKGEDDDDET